MHSLLTTILFMAAPILSIQLLEIVPIDENQIAEIGKLLIQVAIGVAGIIKIFIETRKSRK